MRRHTARLFVFRLICLKGDCLTALRLVGHSKFDAFRARIPPSVNGERRTLSWVGDSVKRRRNGHQSR